MNIGQRAVVGIVVVSVFIYFTSDSNKTTNFGLTNGDIGSIILETETAFDLAEKEVFKQTPDVEPVEPTELEIDPDPDKCICRGTGKIIQGDGHTTPCPYHSEPQQEAQEPEIQAIENKKRKIGKLLGRRN